MPIGTQLEPHPAAFLDRIVSLAADHDRALSLNLDLVFDLVAQKQRRVGFPPNHPSRHLTTCRGKDLNVLGANSEMNLFANLDLLFVMIVSKDYTL
jgi:hypothetical protein